MTAAPFTPPTWEAIRKRSEATTRGLTHFCGDCFMTFKLLNGIPCTKHTLPEERDWRDEVIGKGMAGL